MEAAVVWRVWRRLLREPVLREAVLGGRLDELAAALGLDAPEIEVARAYAEHPAGTEMFVHSYRFRMVSSFFNALETVAPLTHRALLANDVGLREIAVDLLDRREWVDAGPFVYAFGSQILDHLAADKALGEITGLPELIALERAAADVVIEAAAGRPAAEDQDSAVGHWRVRAPFGIHTCDRDLSEWLRDSRTLGLSVPSAASKHYLIFLPTPDTDRRIVAVPRRACDILRILKDRPAELSLLAEELAQRGHPAAPARDRAILDRFEALGLVAAPVGGS
ncbi:hypothetical protein P3L51_30395 [Streptomyces sp. PSRA5]|uniref:hypothetical protein n=1 Tax=Streptomyces panacea TaxID=3035064 RepID=UPI00339D21B2